MPLYSLVAYVSPLLSLRFFWKESSWHNRDVFTDIFISVFTDFLSQQSQRERLFFVNYIVRFKATKRTSNHVIAREREKKKKAEAILTCSKKQAGLPTASKAGGTLTAPSIYSHLWPPFSHHPETPEPINYKTHTEEMQQNEDFFSLKSHSREDKWTQF